MDEYLRENPDVDGTYCVEVKGQNRRIIDASNEVCNLHGQKRCLGRLANHAGMVTRSGSRRRVSECNMKLVDLQFNRQFVPSAPTSVAMFIAIRNIKPLEDLRFDYADPAAQEMFSQ
jgi:hypothetical protein